MVGLGSRLRHLPSQLSGGQQQRVAIARALAGDPRFLLADEPTGNLDSQMADSVMELLGEIHATGTTIIMVTHEATLAMRADRNIHVLDGRVSDTEPLIPLRQYQRYRSNGTSGSKNCLRANGDHKRSSE